MNVRKGFFYFINKFIIFEIIPFIAAIASSSQSNTLAGPSCTNISSTTAERFTIYAYPRGTHSVPAKATTSVPTQDELWASFNSAAGFGLGELNSITMVNTIAGKATEDNLKAVFEKSEWKWLKEYIMNTQNAQKGNSVVGADGTSRTVPELADITSDNAVLWRYAVGAFFLQTQSTGYPATADFTTSGQPSAWGPAYLGKDDGSNDNNDDDGNGESNINCNTPSPEYLKGIVYGSSCRMDGWGDLSKLTIAIYSYDRFGVEHAAVFYEGNEIYEPKVAIYWELNGGTVDVELPTYVTERYVLPIPTKSGYDFNGWYNTKAMRGKKFTDIPAGWEGTLYASWTEAKAEIYWELNGGSVDVDLPTFVRDTYTLPTPYKENNDFEGWYSTADFQGEPITELPANWKGTLYAKWKPTTALPSISVNDKMEVYDILGRFVGTSLPLEKGIFLVKQGDKTYKVIL